jgi:hypothetical protein
VNKIKIITVKEFSGDAQKASERLEEKIQEFLRLGLVGAEYVKVVTSATAEYFFITAYIPYQSA